MAPDFSGQILYNTPTVSFPVSLGLLTFSFFLEQTSTVKAANANALTLANPLFYQTVVQVTFLRFRSILATMATSDHVPEVCLQTSTFQMLAATLYFPFS